MIEWIISSSILIAVIVALRYIFKGKISLRVQYALWALVLLRLLVPISLFSNEISILNIVPNLATSQIEHASDIPLGYVGYELPDLSVAEPDPNLSLAEQEAQYNVNVDQYNQEIEAAKAETGYAVTVRTVLYAIWIAGSMFVGFCLLISNLRFNSRLKKTRTEADSTDCPLKVYVSDRVDTPCLFGLFCPAIYTTPEVMADKTALCHVIAHETTHYRHGDHIWSALRGVCLAVHWFNPLVWLAASLSRRDSELACDEGTITRIGEDERSSYGRTLIGLTCQKRGSMLIMATTMTGNMKSIKERITLIAKKPQMAIYTLVAVVLIAALTVICVFTGARDDTVNTEKMAEVPDLINLEKISEVESDEGILYEFSITNGSVYAIKEFSLAVGFSPLNNPGHMNRDSLAEGAGFIENIAPGEEVILSTLMPKTYYYNKDLDTEVLNIWIEGYVNSVSEETRFGITGSYEGLANTYSGNDDVSIIIDIQNEDSVPDAVIDYAEDSVRQSIEYYADVGEYPHDGIGEYTITSAKITGITQINTGTAALEHSINMYLLEYRLQPDNPENVVLAGGMTMEDGWITEWGSTGQPYLLMLCSWNDSGEDTWQRIGITNTDMINEDYGTPEMLEQYGNAYTAVAMELYNKYLETDSTSGAENSDSWSEEDVERWEDEVALYGFSISPSYTSEFADIGREWAEAYVKQYVENTADDNPLRSISSAVLSSELYAESLIANPKTVIYNIRFACEAADENAFERWFVGWAGPLDAAEYPQYEGWMEFGWFVVLQESEDGSWSCTDAGTGGYGGWGYLNYDGDNVFDLLLKEAIAANGDYTPENVLRYLPLVNWSSFDSRWGAEGWNALWTLLNDCCLTEGRVYGPEETRMWADVYPDDQVYRDLYVMLASLNTDGAYAEGITDILLKQRDYDPELFDYCLQQLTADQQDRINVLVQYAS